MHDALMLDACPRRRHTGGQARRIGRLDFGSSSHARSQAALVHPGKSFGGGGGLNDQRAVCELLAFIPPPCRHVLIGLSFDTNLYINGLCVRQGWHCQIYM